MNSMRALGVAAMAILAAAAFVWTTGGALPPTIASHFDAFGNANGFMTREGYRRLMLAVVIGLPLIVLVATRLNTPQPPAFARHVAWFVVALATFLAFMHWLVVRANAARPVHLSNPGVWGALVVFALFVAVWVVSLRRHPKP